MVHTITLEYWQFLLLALFASVMVLDRILLPGIRWYFRRRVNRVIDEINTRLNVKIRPFLITKRQTLIERLVFDDKVIEAIRQRAQETGMPESVVHENAREYASEIAPAFNAYMYFRVGYWVAKKVARLMYRVRVGFFDGGALRKVDPESSIVFVMNHRSNMDYMLVSFLVAERAAMSYAVGEWARMWPLQTLIKSMGAFFVRRNSGDPLYRRVLERYVNMSTRLGVCQAVFLEGGLSRDGRLREPKLGFLDYMLRDYHLERDRDITFIPVGINYDRVIEDRSLLRRLDPDAQRRSRWFVIRTTVRFFFKMLLLSRKNRWLRFGYASVNFGKPITAKQWCAARVIDFSRLEQGPRFEKVQELAQDLMRSVENVIPVLPVALMAEVLLAHGDRWYSELELKTSAMQRIDALKAARAPIRISSRVRENVLVTALEALEGRGLVIEQEGLYRAEPGAAQLLSYYANSIAQWQRTMVHELPEGEVVA